MPTDAIGHVVDPPCSLAPFQHSWYINTGSWEGLQMLHSSKDKIIMEHFAFHNSYLKYKAGIRRIVFFSEKGSCALCTMSPCQWRNHSVESCLNLNIDAAIHVALHLLDWSLASFSHASASQHCAKSTMKMLPLMFLEQLKQTQQKTCCHHWWELFLRIRQELAVLSFSPALLQALQLLLLAS